MAYETAGQAALPNNEPAADDTEYLVRQHQCQQLLQEAIGLLPPQQKQVYNFVKVDGLSHEMIAAKMKISKHTVKKHMAMALQAIRKYLGARLPLLLLSLVLTGTMY
jgi:RNA polymerase sigma-70 factor (ECF subfamily)